MNGILITVVTCCMVSIIFCTINRFTMAAILITHLSCGITFAISFIQLVLKHNGSAELTYIAIATCFISFAFIQIRTKENAIIGNVGFILFWFFIYAAKLAPFYCILLLAIPLIIPSIFFCVKK